MAKLTYRAFDELVTDTFALAQQNLHDYEHLIQVILGYNAYGRQSLRIAAAAETSTPEAVRTLESDGYRVLAGNPSDHQEEIAALIGQTKTVAVIHVSEAWTVMGAEQIRARQERGESAAENPGRVEVVYVAGLWPREFYASVHTALITRDQAGKPTARPSFIYTNDSPLGPVLDRMKSWLVRLLPQPYGRG